MKRIIDEVSWQEACNGIRCAECALRNNNGSCKFELYVREQPSYEEPKQGEWIPFEWDENWKEKILLTKGSDSHMEEYWAEEFVCSVCGEEHHWSKYCPNCGSRMRSPEANDRQCEKCKHKVETKPSVEACDVWDCSFEPKDEQP